MLHVQVLNYKYKFNHEDTIQEMKKNYKYKAQFYSWWIHYEFHTLHRLQTTLEVCVYTYNFCLVYCTTFKNVQYLELHSKM